MNMNVMLDKDARMPESAHALDAGYDLFSRDDAIIPVGGSFTFDTGVHMEIPQSYFGLIVCKSGLNINNDIISTNGVIDSGYTGSIKVKLQNHGEWDYHIHKGQKISQIVFLPIAKPELVQVDHLNETDRGNAGFGSTGK